MTNVVYQKNINMNILDDQLQRDDCLSCWSLTKVGVKTSQK